MSNTNYVNPDAPSPEVVDAGVRALLAGNQQQSGFSNTYYYAGGYAQNPFASSQNVVSVPSNDSRANVGLNAYQIPQNQIYGYPPSQSQIAPPYAYGQAPTYSQIAPYAYQPPQPQVQVPPGGYAGYPIGVDPSNYIFEYMKANATSKNAWGPNYWTTPKPIESPQIDWTQKAQPADPYAQYGMTVVPQIQMQPQPTLPQGFAFPPLQESPLDVVKKNWKDL
jgi:hypothetical protein